MTDSDNQAAYRPADLIQMTDALFRGMKMDAEKAAVMADVLVEGDLLGHDTHGLNLCAPYLAALENGAMLATGEPDSISDRGPAICWDGRFLPGTWLTMKAVDTAMERAKIHGIAAVTIRRSAHIACLASYLRRATENGFVILLTCSDPSMASVAPYGGLSPVFTPDPFAAGFPTGGDPILIDISASITTNGMTGRMRAEGKLLPHPWLMDTAGKATDDPEVLFADPAGTILPIGGQAYGHKGYGLALIVELLSQALGGFGRAEAPAEWGASTFVQVIDPEAFGGRDGFLRQADHIVSACKASAPAPGVEAVRLPGQQGAERRRQALENGVRLYPTIIPAIKPWAEKLDVEMPKPIG